MSLSNRLLFYSIDGYLAAAPKRFAEADSLLASGHRLASIYFYGYSVEMVIAAGLCTRIYPTLGTEGEITRKIINTVRDRARQESLMTDKTHPIDGLAVLLVAERVEDRTQTGITMTDEIAEEDSLIAALAALIARDWSPSLRYSAIEATEEEAVQVREAASWFLQRIGQL